MARMLSAGLLVEVLQQQRFTSVRMMFGASISQADPNFLAPRMPQASRTSPSPLTPCSGEPRERKIGKLVN